MPRRSHQSPIFQQSASFSYGPVTVPGGSQGLLENTESRPLTLKKQGVQCQALRRTAAMRSRPLLGPCSISTNLSSQPTSSDTRETLNEGAALGSPLSMMMEEPQRGSWEAQSIKRLSSAQVMISRFMGSSPTSGSVLRARSLEPASDSVSPSFSALPCLRSVSLSLKNE